jgi:LmbE family N-acetylglucosaminyl deacetylase
MLALVAHPDDEAWALAPTLSVLAARGAHVMVATATAGEAGKDRSPAGRAGAELAAERTREFERSVRRMGADPVQSAAFEDGKLSEVDEKAWSNYFGALLSEFTPTVWLTLAEDGGYGHRDHVALTQALLRWVQARGEEVWLWCAPPALAEAMAQPLRRCAPQLLAHEAPPPGSCWAAADACLHVEHTRTIVEACVAEHTTQLKAKRPRSFFGAGFWRALCTEHRWQKRILVKEGDENSSFHT